MLYLVLILVVTVGYCQGQCPDSEDSVWGSVTSASGNIVTDIGACESTGLENFDEAFANQVCARHGMHLATLEELQEIVGLEGICSVCNWSVGKTRKFCDGVLKPEDFCQNTVTRYALCSSGELPPQEGWTDWSEWGPCTEDSCQGIQIKTRTCQGGVAGVSPCIGLPFELRNCNTGTCPDPDVAQQNKAEAVCDVLVDLSLVEGPVYAYAKERKVGTCLELCGSYESCGKAVHIYPNVDRRLNRDESQIHLYPNCATIFSSACCCKTPVP